MKWFVKKIVQKFKGVNNEQLEYNLNHDLPWDWRGTKEGFYEKTEKRRYYYGSN